jgi:hypothetical protein
VENYPAPTMLETPVTPASFEPRGSATRQPLTTNAGTVELAPMPHERLVKPVLAAPATTVPPISSDAVNARPATWSERLKYRLTHLGDEDGWAPAAEPSYALPGGPVGTGLYLDEPCASGSCGRWYGSAEYLVWQPRDLHVPALLTTSNDLGDNPPGAIGQPGTVVLFGGEVDYGHLSGGRFTLGAWLDRCDTIGLEGSFFFLERGTRDFAASSDETGRPFLGRPFFDEFENREFVEPVAIPDVLVGRFDASFRTEFLGAELNFRKPFGCPGCWHCWCKDTSILVGVRYLNLHDDIRMREQLRTLVAIDDLSAGTEFDLFDHFESRNQFLGGQIGLETHLRQGPWSIDLRGKLALGGNHQEIDIDGYTLQTGQEPRPGGLLTQRTNIGHYRSDVFSIVSEAGMNVGYQVTCKTRVFVGYQVLYWTNVARADQQIDRVVNRQLTTGGTGEGTRPRFPFRDRDFWAHGLNAGVEVKY